MKNVASPQDKADDVIKAKAATIFRSIPFSDLA